MLRQHFANRSYSRRWLAASSLFRRYKGLGFQASGIGKFNFRLQCKIYGVWRQEPCLTLKSTVKAKKMQNQYPHIHIIWYNIVFGREEVLKYGIYCILILKAPKACPVAALGCEAFGSAAVVLAGA